MAIMMNGIDNNGDDESKIDNDDDDGGGGGRRAGEQSVRCARNAARRTRARRRRSVAAQCSAMDVVDEQVPCDTLRGFKEAIQRLRRSDDRIVNLLNAALPTAATREALNSARERCTSLHEEVRCCCCCCCCAWAPGGPA